jgi:chromosome segregation ATPase
VAIQDLQNRILKWDQNHDNQTQELRAAIQALSDLDIHTEIDAHKHNTQTHQLKSQAAQVRKDCVRVTNLHVQLTQAQHKLLTQYAQAQSHACPMCDQPMHAQKQLEIKTELEAQIAAQDEQIQALLPELHTLQEQDRTLQQSLVDNPLIPTVYDSLEQAVDHRNSLQQLEKELVKLQSEINPYSDQTATLESTLQEISYAELNELQTLKEHQEFLLRLLINKDSFIRKKIIDQNLTYLNHRLTDYLNTLGISHDVKFLNDLSVEINYMGQDMDFAQLSRGESTRVILALSWAFRDIWENQNTSMNFLGVDELIDVGLDQTGVDKSMEVLKMFSRDRHKHVLLISHRDELMPKCDRVLAVIKEGGFTRLQSDWDI